jgi:hypothetical protein
MKSLVAALLLGGVALLSGCAFHKQAVVLDAVGPSPLHPAAAGPKGALVVYSALDSSADFNGLPYIPHYTDYKVLSDKGTLLQLVHNRKGGAEDGPLAVELPAGNYRVSAQADAYLTVTVPVVILAGRLTTVHLEGSPSWPDRAALLRSNPVRLPDGEIAGWRAGTESLSNP